jgi:hypothetical protein
LQWPDIADSFAAQSNPRRICTVSQSRESLIAELREIERMDGEYYSQQDKSRVDLHAHTARQQRRHQILLELAAQEHNRRRHSRLSLSTDVTLFCLGHGIIKGRISGPSESGFAAVLPSELELGETVTAEIHLPFGSKTAEAIVRNRNAFRHGFGVSGDGFIRRDALVAVADLRSSLVASSQLKLFSAGSNHECPADGDNPYATRCSGRKLGSVLIGKRVR